MGLKSFQHTPKDKRKIVLQKWGFIVQTSIELNNEFYQFWRQHSFFFIPDDTLLMSTIFKCERPVWKALTESIGCDWHCHPFHFALGKRHPCRFMCIWTLLIFSLLCTLGSCDMEIFSTVFREGVYCRYLHKKRNNYPSLRFYQPKIFNVWFLNNPNLFSICTPFKGISSSLCGSSRYFQWLFPIQMF